MDKSLQTRLIGMRREARFLGWPWVIGYRLLKRIGIKELPLRVRGLKSKVYCRIEGSDIYEFKQSLGAWTETFNLPFAPKVIVDAGANVGYTALRFQKQFPGVQIIAIEPEANNIAQFEKNCSPYPNITLVRGALWTRGRTLSIQSAGVDSNAFQLIEDPSGNIPGFSVLDLMRMFNVEHIDVLKMDIEGSEKIIFEDDGVKKWLPRVRAILVETHDVTLGIKGCSASVRSATAESLRFMGHVNEYEYYLSKSVAPE
jgi:FkbM family methyltransferase